MTDAVCPVDLRFARDGHELVIHCDKPAGHRRARHEGWLLERLPIVGTRRRRVWWTTRSPKPEPIFISKAPAEDTSDQEVTP